MFFSGSNMLITATDVLRSYNSTNHLIIPDFWSLKHISSKILDHSEHTPVTACSSQTPTQSFASFKVGRESSHPNGHSAQKTLVAGPESEYVVTDMKSSKRRVL